VAIGKLTTPSLSVFRFGVKKHELRFDLWYSGLFRSGTE